MRMLCPAVFAALLFAAPSALGQQDDVSLEGTCATPVNATTFHATSECLETLKKDKKNLFTHWRQAPHVGENGASEFKLTKRNLKPKK